MGTPVTAIFAITGSFRGLRTATGMRTAAGGLNAGASNSNTFSCVQLLPPLISPSCCEANTRKQVWAPTSGTQSCARSTRPFAAMVGIFFAGAIGLQLPLSPMPGGVTA